MLSGGSGGGQPCAVALKTSGIGISITGGGVVNTPNCTLRSNSGAVVGGNSPPSTTSWLYATSVAINGHFSTITNGSSTVDQGNVGSWNNSAPLDVTSSTIRDPYADNTAIQNAFKSLRPGTGTTW